MAQNAKVIEEARTAVATGEIRTPSIASPETSHAGDGDKEIHEGSPTARTSESLSSGEEYVQSSSECYSSHSNQSSEAYTESRDTKIRIGATESCDEEEYSTSVATGSEYSGTEEEDSSCTLDTASTDHNPKVCTRHPFEF